MIKSLYYNSSICAWDLLWISNLHRAVSFSVLLQRHCSTPIVAHHKHRGQRWISELRKFSKSKVSPKKKIARDRAIKSGTVPDDPGQLATMSLALSPVCPK